MTHGGNSARRQKMKVSQIETGGGGTLIVKVVAHLVRIKHELHKKNRQEAFAEVDCAEILVGDDSGCVLFFALNEQIESMKPGCSVMIQNFNTEVVGSCLRVRVDMWGDISPVEPGLTCQVNMRNNVSFLNRDYDAVLSEYIFKSQD
jgi:hypothetical protein